MIRRPTRRPTRRAALLGSLGVLGGLGGLGPLLTACDTDDLRPLDADAPVAPSATASGAPTADEALVAQAADAIGSTMTTVAAARLVPSLRRSLTPLYRDHRRHLAALDDSRATAPGPDLATAATDAAAVLAGVTSAEAALQGQLVDLAVRAESGTLAALLASMSASVAQHRSALGPG